MGEEDFLHQLLLLGISTTSIAEIVLRTGAHAFPEVSLLESLGKGDAHHGGEVGIFAIRLFQSVETGHPAHIHHGREGEYSAHLAHGRAGLPGFEFSQLGVEGASLTYLLWIDGCAPGVDP